MVHLIDKSAVVAEIKRILSAFENSDAPVDRLRASTLIRLLSFIDTLEVKEVDLEKEVNAYMVNEMKFLSDEIGYDTFLTIAKHFFELGLSVNNPITAADKGTAEEIIINLKRVEQDYRIDLTKEIGWVRNKVKKGEEV